MPELPKPPIATKIEYFHKYEHSSPISDDYHWMKDQNPTKRQEILTHLKMENDYTNAIHLTPTQSLTDTIYSEILSKMKEDDDSVPVEKNGYFTYSYTVKGLEYSIYARRKESMNSPEEIILNQNDMKHEYMDLGDISISPDNKILAYSLDIDGSENYSIFFKNLETGNIFDSDTILKASGNMVWSNDSKSIYYTTLDAIHRPFKVFQHVLGMDCNDDRLIYHEKDEKFIVGVSKSMSAKYIFITTGSSLTEETWILDANIFDSSSGLRVFQEREYNHKYSVEHHGEQFLIISNGVGKYLNFSLFSCPLDKTEKSNWSELIPYDPLKHIIDVIPFKNHIAIYECSDALKHFRILEADSNGKFNQSESYYLEFTESTYCLEPSQNKSQNFESDSLRFTFESMKTSLETWNYDFKNRKRTLLKKKEVLGEFDPNEYTTKRIFAPIPEGKLVNAPSDTPTPKSIPISLIYKTSMFKGDGTNPCLLYGYGSYGISIDPSWSYSKFSLLDRGYVYAIAHIRGGGDCGRGWYETGKFMNKKNTFYDFISCAEEIVKSNISSHKIMAIEGRSAGGLLIGTTLNLRPDIAGVAIAGVPFVDVTHTMMDPTIPLTINEYEEWGNPNEKKFFDYMYSYSPYDNVRKDIIYPHILVKAGINDPRVQYWEPMKWVAKLREYNVGRDQKVIAFDCKMGHGHFGSSGRYSHIKETAADYAFVITRIQEIQEMHAALVN